MCGLSALLTTNHLVPRREGGAKGATVEICRECHRQIHALFEHRELALTLNSIEELRADPEMARYLALRRKGGRVRPPRRRRR
jgi:hypothetical protein